MGKCENCGKAIRYNKFKRYRGKVLCYDCYDTRLERKKQKKLEAKEAIKEMNADEEAKKYGFNPEPIEVPEEEKEEPTDPTL